MTTGERLKKIRLAKDLKLKDVSHSTNIHKNTLHNWEADICSPSITTLLILAEFYEMSLSRLLNGVDGKRSNNDD